MVEHLPPSGTSAYFRARFPNSWWWTPDHDFLALVLVTLQGANWQRGGGKGDKPKQIKRPSERKPKFTSAAELKARKNRIKQRHNDKGGE